VKTFCFRIDPYMIGYNSAIRSKASILKLLFDIIKFIHVYPEKMMTSIEKHEDDENLLLVLNVDKMSRIFICEKNKIHSFQFPFQICTKNGQHQIFFKHVEIDSGILAVLSTTFYDISDDTSIITVIGKYWDSIEDLQVNAADAKTCEELITFILAFEPGYLRFDHDSRRKDAIHPLDHLDFFYSNLSTLKFGVEEKLVYSDMIDILDKTKHCYRLRPPLKTPKGKKQLIK